MGKSRNKIPPQSTMTLPRVEVPPLVRATPAEIVRRRALFEQTMELRDKIGPIDIPSDELIHQARAELV